MMCICSMHEVNYPNHNDSLLKPGQNLIPTNTDCPLSTNFGQVWAASWAKVATLARTFTFIVTNRKPDLENDIYAKQLTSFLSNGIRNGSLTLRPATMVIIGSRQLKMAPNMSIFPNLGSTGSIDRWWPEIQTARFDDHSTYFFYFFAKIKKEQHVINASQDRTESPNRQRNEKFY